MTASNRYETDYNLCTDYATLKITNTQKHDLGNYLVIAENIAGRDQTSCKLCIDLVPNVDERPLIDPEVFKFLEPHPKSKPGDLDDDLDDKNKAQNYIPPRVIVPLYNVRLSESEPIRLVCKVDGYPKPKVHTLT